MTAFDDRAAGREVRLEGASLWIAGGLLFAMLVGAFYLGRWSASGDAAAGPRGPDPLGQVRSAEPAPARDPAGFFDKVGDSGGREEPRRQARTEPPSAGAPAVRTATPGDWFVQVFAGRDREAAEVLVRRLGASGHAVRLDAEAEGQGALYKVRVGGFATKEAADAAAGKLRTEGESGAWVVRLGG